MNLDLDDFPGSYIRRMSTAKCPQCKTRFDLGGLVVEGGSFYVRGVARWGIDGLRWR